MCDALYRILLAYSRDQEQNSNSSNGCKTRDSGDSTGIIQARFWLAQDGAGSTISHGQVRGRVKPLASLVETFFGNGERFCFFTFCSSWGFFPFPAGSWEARGESMYDNCTHAQFVHIRTLVPCRDGRRDSKSGARSRGRCGPGTRGHGRAKTR